MAGDIKKIADLMAKAQAPFELVLVSDHLSPSAVAQYAKGVKIQNAICAEDPKNTEKISLRNIFRYIFLKGGETSTQKNKRKKLADIISILQDPKRFSELGVYKFSPEGIDNEKVKKIWWNVESNTPGAMAALAKYRRKASSTKSSGQQLIKLFDAVDTTFTSQISTLMKNEVSMQNCEALENVLMMAKGFKRFKEARSHLSGILKSNKVIKKEYRVKKLYLMADKLISSKGSKSKKKGKNTMIAIAKKFPDTIYGKKAAAK